MSSVLDVKFFLQRFIDWARDTPFLVTAVQTFLLSGSFVFPLLPFPDCHWAIWKSKGLSLVWVLNCYIAPTQQQTVYFWPWLRFVNSYATQLIDVKTLPKIFTFFYIKQILAPLLLLFINDTLFLLVFPNGFILVLHLKLHLFSPSQSSDLKTLIFLLSRYFRLLWFMTCWWKHSWSPSAKSGVILYLSVPSSRLLAVVVVLLHSFKQLRERLVIFNP